MIQKELNINQTLTVINTTNLTIVMKKITIYVCVFVVSIAKNPMNLNTAKKEGAVL